MKRNDPAIEGLLHSEEGLWAAVLLNIMNEIEASEDRDGYEQAKLIIMEPEGGPLPFIAAALGLDTGELQRKIIRWLKKRGRCRSHLEGRSSNNGHPGKALRVHD